MTMNHYQSEYQRTQYIVVRLHESVCWRAGGTGREGVAKATPLRSSHRLAAAAGFSEAYRNRHSRIHTHSRYWELHSARHDEYCSRSATSAPTPTKCLVFKVHPSIYPSTQNALRVWFMQRHLNVPQFVRTSVRRRPPIRQNERGHCVILHKRRTPHHTPPNKCDWLKMPS